MDVSRPSAVYVWQALSLCLLSLCFAVVYIYIKNMLSCGCLNIDIYKELTILMQFSNQWGLQCGKAVFSILVFSIRLWSFFLLGILYQYFYDPIVSEVLSIGCELGFLFWVPIYVCLYTVMCWWGSKMIPVGDAKCRQPCPHSRHSVLKDFVAPS